MIITPGQLYKLRMSWTKCDMWSYISWFHFYFSTPSRLWGRQGPATHHVQLFLGSALVGRANLCAGTESFILLRLHVTAFWGPGLYRPPVPLTMIFPLQGWQECPPAVQLLLISWTKEVANLDVMQFYFLKTSLLSVYWGQLVHILSLHHGKQHESKAQVTDVKLNLLSPVTLTGRVLRASWDHCVSQLQIYIDVTP